MSEIKEVQVNPNHPSKEQEARKSDDRLALTVAIIFTIVLGIMFFFLAKARALEDNKPKFHTVQKAPELG